MYVESTKSTLGGDKAALVGRFMGGFGRFVGGFWVEWGPSGVARWDQVPGRPQGQDANVSTKFYPS